MLLKALKPWFNMDHEGSVSVDQQFEASEYRASELIRNGLAIPIVSETEKIKVPSDPPRPEPPKRREPEAEEPYASSRRTSRQSDHKHDR
jgi:hypothetical protein